MVIMRRRSPRRVRCTTPQPNSENALWFPSTSSKIQKFRRRRRIGNCSAYSTSLLTVNRQAASHVVPGRRLARSEDQMAGPQNEQRATQGLLVWSLAIALVLGLAYVIWLFALPGDQNLRTANPPPAKLDQNSGSSASPQNSGEGGQSTRAPAEAKTSGSSGAQSDSTRGSAGPQPETAR